MAENPGLHVIIQLHGACLVCARPLDEDVGEVVLVEKKGAFVRFTEADELYTPDVSFSWLCVPHVN